MLSEKRCEQLEALEPASDAQQTPAFIARHVIERKACDGREREQQAIQSFDGVCALRDRILQLVLQIHDRVPVTAR